MINKIEYERQKTRKELQNLVGQIVTVAVSIGGMVRSDFVTQMSIKGELEGALDSFRVLRDECTYTYFMTDDVYLINPFVSTGIVLHVKIDTPEDE